MRHVAGWPLTLILLALASAASGEMRPWPELRGPLRLEPTGIVCVRRPCPHYQIRSMKPGPDTPAIRLDIEEFPELTGSEEDVARVRKAVAALRCLDIEGRLTSDATEDPPQRLKIVRVIADCVESI